MTHGVSRIVGALLVSLVMYMSCAASTAHARPPQQPPEPAGRQQAGTDYDAQGRRDPFGLLLQEPAVQPPPESLCPRTGPRGPLERFDVSTLKVIGILWGEFGMRAMITAPDGKSHVATMHSVVGQHCGTVVAIHADHLVIEEQYDVDGQIVKKPLTLWLRQREDQDR
jgi:Tfp pilus assembly protein PilP